MTTDRSVQRLLILGFAICACAFMGGSSRADVASLIVLRPILITATVALLVLPGGWELAPFKPLFALLALVAATMLVQLIPVPPDLWIAMPGHAALAPAAAGQPQPWRPISLAPDLTINSLLALLPATTVLIAFAGMRTEQRRQAIWLVVSLAIASAILGIVQIADGPASFTYFYDVGSDALPVGFLANRNHQALLLASAFPMIGFLVGNAQGGLGATRALFAVAVVLLLLLTILVTGSRAGLVLAAVGIAATVLLLLRPDVGAERRKVILTWGAVILAGLLFVGTAVAMGRAVSIDRLLADDSTTELRFQLVPISLRMIADYMPFGMGYGAYEAVFRAYEPDAMLRPTFVNHAHNDLLELLMTGGAPVVLPLLGFAAWFIRKGRLVRRSTSASARLALASTVTIGMILGASLVDYPLRTALLSAVFTMACCFLAASEGRGNRTVDSGA